MLKRPDSGISGVLPIESPRIRDRLISGRSQRTNNLTQKGSKTYHGSNSGNRTKKSVRVNSSSSENENDKQEINNKKVISKENKLYKIQPKIFYLKNTIISNFNKRESAALSKGNPLFNDSFDAVDKSDQYSIGPSTCMNNPFAAKHNQKEQRRFFTPQIVSKGRNVKQVNKPKVGTPKDNISMKSGFSLSRQGTNHFSRQGTQKYSRKDTYDFVEDKRSRSTGKTPIKRGTTSVFPLQEDKGPLKDNFGSIKSNFYSKNYNTPDLAPRQR